MHKLLERQLRKAATGADGNLDYDALLKLVDQAYQDHERERTINNQAAKLMEEELREANRLAKLGAERHLKAILDTAGEGVVIADKRGIILDINLALLRIFGYERDELIGQNISVLVNRQQAASHNGYIDRYHRTGEARLIGRGREETARRKSGEEFPIELSVGDLSATGLSQYVGIVRDISERRLAQEKQRQSEQLFRDFAQSSSDWFWETDEQHHFSRFTGYSPTLSSLINHGVIGQTRLDLMTSSGVTPEKIAEHKAILEAHQPFRDFMYTITEEGQKPHIFKVSGKPVFSESGNFLGYRGSASDVTEQEAARARLLAAESRLVDALSSISDGFVLYDSDDRLVMHNDRYGVLFPQIADFTKPGMAFDEIIQEGLSQGVYTLPSGGQEAWLARRRSNHRNANGQHFLQEMADGRWIRSTEYPTRDGGVVGIHTDITASVGMEQALRLAKEQAEAANRAKSEFLATMSHEIRTPMNGIIGMTDLLLDTPMTEEQRHFANTVRISAEALLSIINDILDISKMEAGKIDFEENAFDLPTLIEGVVDILSPRVKARDLDLTYFVAPEASGYYVGDAGRLRQVLLNLAGNSVKFTEHGSVSIMCECLGAVPGETG